MIGLSQMFTWVVKKCLNLTFKVNFLCQKSFESFWFFFSLKNISLEEGFLLWSFFENFNFWTTLFSKMMPNFWRSVWTPVKVKSKNYFYFTIFLLKSTRCWLTFAKLHHWGHTNLHERLLKSHADSNRQFSVKFPPPAS